MGMLAREVTLSRMFYHLCHLGCNLREKNLLLVEQIPSFKSRSLWEGVWYILKQKSPFGQNASKSASVSISLNVYDS